MKKLLLIVLGIVVVSSLYGVDLSNRNMTLRFNGHDHLVHDIISDSLQAAYTKWKVDIGQEIFDYLHNMSGITSISISLPSAISKITFCQETSGNGQMNIRIPDWNITFNYSACNFDIDFDLNISAKMKTEVDTCYWLKIYDITNHGKINMDVEPREWYQFWNYLKCGLIDILLPFIYEYQFADQIEDEMRDMRLEIFSIKDLPGDCTDPTLVQEAIESFPIDFSFTHDGSSDSNLVISLDFMQGTKTNPTAFTGIQPDPVTHNSYDHLGFGCTFENFMYAYETSIWTDTTIANPIECATAMLNLMSNTSAQSIRLEVPWLKIQGNIPIDRVNCGLDPDFLDTPAGQDTINAYMSRSSWQDFDSVLTLIFANHMEPILNIGLGHTSHAPKIGNDLLMVPNSEL